MTILYPEGTSVQGNLGLVLMTAVADLDSPDLSSEINAVTSLAIQCFVRDFNPQIQNNTGFAPARACTTVQLPLEGNTQFSPIEVRYVFDPQGDPAADANKAKAFLTRGTEFYAFERKGLDGQNVAMAATQRGRIWKFRAGRQNEDRSGQDEFAEYEIAQQWFPLIEPVDAVIVA
jgi:hypothetical protein